MLPSRLRAALAAAFLLLASCHIPGDILGPDEQFDGELVGCLTAGGSAPPSLNAIVPSVTPWVSQVPGLGPTLDAQLTQITVYAANQFRVYPSVRYYDERGTPPNAFATPVNTEQSRDGSVRLGVNLVASEALRFITSEYGVTRLYSYSITAVLAHELAHIVQFKRGAGQMGRNTELQADFLAGWYFAHLAQVDPNFGPNMGVRDGMAAFYSRGDYNFNQPSHHGTHDQRLAAFLAGYESRAVGIDQAWQAAVLFRNSIGG